MNKKTKAKEDQGYNVKPILAICSNCMHYKSDMVKLSQYSSYTAEKTKRCCLGSFAVMKTATCNYFSPEIL